MNRRTLVIASAFSALAVLAQQGATGAPAPPAQTERPNIVLITTDDQTVESLRVMTNVRRLLADRGSTFESSFATFPLCCPARATWLTGQYAHNHGVVGNHWANGYKKLDQTNTLPVWLQRSGYRTIFVGKYLNGYGTVAKKEIPPGWTDWYAGVSLAYYRHSMNRNGAIVRYRGTSPESYQTDIYAQTALEALRGRAGTARPFFLWLSFFAPHAGSPREVDDPDGFRTPVPAVRHRDLLASEPMPRPPSFDEVDVLDKPADIQRRPRLRNGDAAALREVYQQRLESLLAVDEAVALLVAELRRQGVLGKTLIVFTSDNGFMLGEHRVRSGKELVYEPSIRVPLIVRGPGVPAGLRFQQPVANVDLAPTLAAAAKVKLGRTPDGRSLLPLFGDPGLEWGRDILIERGPGSAGLGDRLVTALRTPRYLYAEHITGERELYDLSVDPDEVDSRHHEPAYDEIEAELARRLALLRNCAGPTCLQGPDLVLALVDDGACTRSARVAGLDERFVQYVDFLVDGRGVARDEAAPFEQALAAIAPGQSVRLRTVAVLRDGRRVSLDTTTVPCA